MIELKLPSLGSDMEEGKLLEWRVKPGDLVKRGDVIAVVDTTKAAIDVESWNEGIVHELLIEPETTIPVGAVMAILRAPGETPEQAAQAWEAARKLRALRAERGLTGPAATSAATRRRISPAARKRAAELSVNLEAVVGTGPQGAVTVEDVERGAQAAARPPDRAAAMRQTIAAAMARSKREIPHYYLSEDVPLGRATEWLARCNLSRPVTARLLLAPLLLKSVALALTSHPEFNGYWKDGAFQPGAGIHLGVAISLRQGGLIAPCIHDADQKSLETLRGELTDLVARARAGSLRSPELSDGTVTVTNVGDQGVAEVFGVIYPPQVALLGFGRVAERPWVVDGVVRPMPALTASLSADHRASDGHRGGRLLARVRDLLQSPEEL